MTRRLRHRPRAACPLAPLAIDCHAFGREDSCGLCNMIDMDAPTTVVTLGRTPASDELEPAEATFWRHLARRTDGGPVTPTELAAKLARKRGVRTPEVFRAAARAAVAASSLPIEPPF